MTANERLEALLNRAGQTISDLPTWGGDVRRLGRAKREALTEMGDRWTDSTTVSADEMPLLEYILRLTDIIDRMEWALENALNEQSGLTEQDLKDLETLRKVRTGKILKKVCGDFTIINGDFERRMPHYPVVFCQDCKRRLNCLISGGTDAGNCNPYFYCADGEREADE